MSLNVGEGAQLQYRLLYTLEIWQCGVFYQTIINNVACSLSRKLLSLWWNKVNPYLRAELRFHRISRGQNADLRISLCPSGPRQADPWSSRQDYRAARVKALLAKTSKLCTSSCWGEGVVQVWRTPTGSEHRNRHSLLEPSSTDETRSTWATLSSMFLKLLCKKPK